MKYREEPLMLVMRSASRPPVQLSATDRVAPRICRKYPTICSSDSPPEEKISSANSSSSSDASFSTRSSASACVAAPRLEMKLNLACFG